MGLYLTVVSSPFCKFDLNAGKNNKKGACSGAGVKENRTHQNIMPLGSVIWWLEYKLWSQTACAQILALTV